MTVQFMGGGAGAAAAESENEVLVSSSEWEPGHGERMQAVGSRGSGSL